MVISFMEVGNQRRRTPECAGLRTIHTRCQGSKYKGQVCIAQILAQFTRGHKPSIHFCWVRALSKLHSFYFSILPFSLLRTCFDINSLTDSYVTRFWSVTIPLRADSLSAVDFLQDFKSWPQFLGSLLRKLSCFFCAAAVASSIGHMGAELFAFFHTAI